MSDTAKLALNQDRVRRANLVDEAGTDSRQIMK